MKQDNIQTNYQQDTKDELHGDEMCTFILRAHWRKLALFVNYYKMLDNIMCTLSQCYLLIHGKYTTNICVYQVFFFVKISGEDITFK